MYAISPRVACTDFTDFLPDIVVLAVVGLTHLSGGRASMDIFVLSGQSNMAGRGGVRAETSGTPQHLGTPNAQIVRLTALKAWEPAAEPMHKDIDVTKTCGVGPGLVFAQEMYVDLCAFTLVCVHVWTDLHSARQRPGSVPLGLVPCAVGGTEIAQWHRGGELYTAMVRTRDGSPLLDSHVHRRLRRRVWTCIGSHSVQPGWAMHDRATTCAGHAYTCLCT